MPIEYETINVPKKTFVRGGKTITIPAHKCVKVRPPHTIWQLATQRKKSLRNEKQYGRDIAMEILKGKMKIVDGEVVAVDPYGVKPDSKVGVTSRIMDYLRLKFGFY
jgi:hypothetical protein